MGYPPSRPLNAKLSTFSASYGGVQTHTHTVRTTTEERRVHAGHLVDVLGDERVGKHGLFFPRKTILLP